MDWLILAFLAAPVWFPLLCGLIAFVVVFIRPEWGPLHVVARVFAREFRARRDSDGHTNPRRGAANYRDPHDGAGPQGNTRELVPAPPTRRPLAGAQKTLVR